MSRDIVSLTRQQLGIEERRCQDCRWLYSVANDPNACQEPAWVANGKRFPTCGSQKGLPKWEPAPITESEE